jgi:hypothetical protein
MLEQPSNMNSLIEKDDLVDFRGFATFWLAIQKFRKVM